MHGTKMDEADSGCSNKNFSEIRQVYFMDG